MTATPAKAVIYARYSTKMQNESSVEDQTRRCRSYAERQGWSVVEVYDDKALSGTNTHRPGLIRLLGDATNPPFPFKFILVDDLSRLSRDLGDTWDIVFRRLAKARVVVVDIKSGQRSDDPNARFIFGATALFADNMIQVVRAQTHRGLEGRALNGYWTGGRVYGYQTVAIANDAAVRRPPKVLKVNADEAANVRRIFQWYAEGMALGAIASRLNDEGLPSPHASTRRTNDRVGWSFTTIREMLRNRLYSGEVVWNRTQYVRDPVTRNRRAVQRDESEWTTRREPALRIIDETLWDAVQARLIRKARAGKGRPPGTGKEVYVFSGILQCGDCGGPMSIIGAKKKADGKRYPSFGCSTTRAKGGSVCSNTLTVSDGKLNTLLLGALGESLASPEVTARFVERFEAAVAARQNAATPELTEADRRLADKEREARNLGAALGRMGYSETLAAQLSDAEAALRTLRDERARVARAAAKPMPKPTPDFVAGYLRDLRGTLTADPVKANALLARHLGKVRMEPKTKGPGRFYRASGAFDLSVDLAVLGKGGCGARI
jgi:site-specific DNA recombinase